ncbi:hypothetical protein DYB32_006503 [Aphanomyces invadans]|uniref:Cystatin domain-containing protein n=1 Tax=Aphanomyces invadans TaxID=157072 RepID=A0A3R6VUY9_9STRA|nr:hypothetical protein DYB32_006503 [Aphanomyces invadans]
MLHMRRALLAVAAMAATADGVRALGGRSAPQPGYRDGDLTYVAVSPKDPFVDMTAAQFVDDYQTKLHFHFATIHANRVVTAEVAKHSVDADFNWDGDHVVLNNDVLTTTGYTYRVNLFLALHFDSVHFGGPKYHTVASADYTCTNDTTTGELCKPESFLENPRRVQNVDAIPSLVQNTLNAKLSLHFTAYETQALTTHTPGALMHYVAFSIQDEPVHCRASLYFDGLKTHVLHYNTDCLTSPYDSAMFHAAERDGKEIPHFLAK